MEFYLIITGLIANFSIGIISMNYITDGEYFLFSNLVFKIGISVGIYTSTIAIVWASCKYLNHNYNIKENVTNKLYK